MGNRAKSIMIDLTDMPLQAVLEVLRQSGYNADAYQTEMWVPRDTARHGFAYQSPPVFVVRIKEEDASALSCKIFNGKTVTLKPGQDLHLMLEIPGGNAAGQWCIVDSSHILA